MLSFYDACKIAVNYFFEKYGETELANQDKIGHMGILVFKEDGEIEDFILPSKTNFKLLKEAIPIEMNRE